MGTNMQMIKAFKKVMTNEFEMTDLGPMKYFLGIQVKQELGRIFISQAKYACDLLKRFYMKNYQKMMERKKLMSQFIEALLVHLFISQIQGLILFIQ